MTSATATDAAASPGAGFPFAAVAASRMVAVSRNVRAAWEIAAVVVMDCLGVEGESAAAGDRGPVMHIL